MSSERFYEDTLSLAPRAQKGESLLAFVADYTAIDLETTGLDPRRDSVIEFGAIRVRGNCIDERFSALVNPGRLLSPFITELTGITDDMLCFAPPLEDVLPDFLTFVGEDVVVGHNVNFDLGFIRAACRLMGAGRFDNDYVDTMRLSRRLFPQHAHHRLGDLVARFGIGEAVEHRALADVAQTIDCYEYMKAYAARRGMARVLPEHKQRAVSAREITPGRGDFDERHACYKRTFVFTGELYDMTRREAMQAVADRGGMLGDSVTRRTNYLVLGGCGYATTIRGGVSAKQKKAEQMKLEGYDIEIIAEREFYHLLGEE